MGNDTDSVDVRFGADTDPLVAGLRKAGATLDSTLDSMKKSLTSLSFATAAYTVIAVAAAGAMAKIAHETEQAVRQTVDLSNILAISTQEMSALKVALDDIGTGTELYVGALNRMTVHLREGEYRFRELGITTRDSNGHLLNGQQIMQNSFKALLQFKEGTDRNLASTEIFGRNWSEVQRLMRLTPEVMEEARKKTEDLQLTIGPAGAERAEKYRAAMNDLKDVFEGLGNRVGQAVMPILTELATWFSSIGPEAVKVMRVAIATLGTVFWGLQHIVVEVFQTVKAALFTFIEPFAAIFEAVALAFQGKWSEAGDRLKEVPAQIEAAWKNSNTAIMDNMKTTVDNVKSLWSFKQEQGPSGPKAKTGGDKTFTPKDAFDAEMAEMKARIAAFKEGSLERIQIAGEMANRIGQRYGLESKQYKEALAEMSKYARDRMRQQRELDEIALQHDRDFAQSRVDIEKENLDFLKEVGAITEKERLDRLKKLKDLEFQIELKAAQDRAALLEADVVAYARAQEQIEQIKRKHDLDMRKLDNQMKIEAIQVWKEIGQAMQSAFATAIKGVIMGTMSIKDAFKSLAKSVLETLIDMAAKSLAQWITNAITSTMVSKTAGAAEITTNAAVAATAAMASVAAIPIYGWAMAPEVGAETFALAEAYTAALASMDVGSWQVPQDMVAKIHKDETILPVPFAEEFRQNAQGMGSGGETHIHTHFHGDVYGQEDFDRKVAKSVRNQSRNANPDLRRTTRRV